MVIGQNGRGEDIEVNVCKKNSSPTPVPPARTKRCAFTPPKILSLEQALDFIETDELLGGNPQEPAHPQENPGPHQRKRANMNRNS